MRVIIIDDERNVAEGFLLLLKKMDDVNCVGMAHNALDGAKLVKAQQPDVVFLDINMPQHTGFDFLEAVEKNFLVVFTTAHEEYAIQAIKHKAFDYLLKPIDMDDLTTCIQKLRQGLSSREKTKTTAHSPALHIPVKEGTLLIKQEDIIHIEANGSYSVIYTTDGKKHTVTKNLKALEELLTLAIFFRCHNSHIVNIQRVKKILRSENLTLEMDNGDVVEVSRNKKDELLSRL